MSGFHGGFFIWDELEKIGGRKMSEKCEIPHFLGKNPLGVPVQVELYRYRYEVGNLYRYRQGCTGIGCAVGNLYRYRSKVYRYMLFQQPCFDMFSRR